MAASERRRLFRLRVILLIVFSLLFLLDANCLALASFYSALSYDEGIESQTSVLVW